jgi:hypothetical protein
MQREPMVTTTLLLSENLPTLQRLRREGVRTGIDCSHEAIAVARRRVA